MKEAVHHQDLTTEFWTPELCYIVEHSNSDNDPEASIARARVEPGVTTRWHIVRDITERYYIQEGKGLVEVGDMAPVEVNPGDVVVIPPSCPQRITNTGDCDLIFLAICTPRFLVEAYEDIEEQMAAR